MAKVLLTHGYFLQEDPREQRIMKPYPPLGLLYIAAFLEERGVSVSVFDTTFTTREDLHARILRDPPAVLAVYTNMMTRPSVVALLRFVRAEPSLANVRVVLGGPEITHHIEKFLEHGADALVLGEGEQTMHELLDVWSRGGFASCGVLAEALTSVPGLAFRGPRGETVRTPERKLLPSMDVLPFPKRDAIDLSPYLEAWRTRHGQNALSISTMRGCPYSCRWCSRAVYGATYRRRSPKLVADEIELLLTRYKPDTLWFVDDVFTINHSWLANFTNELETRRLRVPYECITRADRLNERAIELLQRSGCFRVWIGAESGSQKILDAMDRRVKVEQVRSMIQLAKKSGIEAGTFIMLGYPGETAADIAATIEHLKSSDPDQFTITVSYPIKGTPFHDEVAQQIEQPRGWEESTDRDAKVRRDHSSIYYRFAIDRVIHEVHGHRAARTPSRLSKLRAVRHGASALVARVGMRADPIFRAIEKATPRLPRVRA